MSSKRAATTADPDVPPAAKRAGPEAPDAKAPAPAAKDGTRRGTVSTVEADSFESEAHFYPRVLNATIHPLVRVFLTMSNKRLLKRFCHMNPKIDFDDVLEKLSYRPKWFRWAGCDTFATTTPAGNRRTVVVETNSCPSGQKSMPLAFEDEEMGGYGRLLRHTFLPRIAQENCPVKGRLAVVFDKNVMEASGYAAALAEISGEKVLMAEFYDSDPDPPVRFDSDGVMTIRDDDGKWVPIRAAFRYVTQRPWNRIPLHTKTLVLNPTVCCLAGGRNKLLAAKAYELYNGELAGEGSGLRIQIPETVCDVGLAEVPLWVARFGGHAVVKVPYSNAGQGVYTLLCEDDLKAFMADDHPYDKFVVQSLIGNSKWSSTQGAGSNGKAVYFHIGTLPDRRGDIFVSDLRMMVSATDEGFRPIAVYARKAHKPLIDAVPTKAGDAWQMLGTNLSVKTGRDRFDTEANRLVLMDRKDFNTLGLGVDDLIEAYVQTVLSVIAIDRMCIRLMEGAAVEGTFNFALFKSLNDDESLDREVERANTAHLATVAAAGAGAGAGAGTGK